MTFSARIVPGSDGAETERGSPNAPVLRAVLLVYAAAVMSKPVSRVPGRAPLSGALRTSARCRKYRKSWLVVPAAAVGKRRMICQPTATGVDAVSTRAAPPAVEFDPRRAAKNRSHVPVTP